MKGPFVDLELELFGCSIYTLHFLILDVFEAYSPEFALFLYVVDDLGIYALI